MGSRSAERVITGEDGDNSAEVKERSGAEAYRVAKEVILGAAGRYGVADVLTRRFCTDSSDRSIELSRVADEFMEEHGYDKTDGDPIDGLDRAELLKQLDEFVEKYFGSSYEDATRDTEIMKAYKRLDKTVKVIADFDSSHGTAYLDEFFDISLEPGRCTVGVHEALSAPRESSEPIGGRHELIAKSLLGDGSAAGIIDSRLEEMGEDHDDFDFEDARFDYEKKREQEQMAYIRRGMVEVFGVEYMRSLQIGGKKISECANLTEVREFAETSSIDRAFSGDDLPTTSNTGVLEVVLPAEEGDTDGYPGGPIKLQFRRDGVGEALRPFRIGTSKSTEDGRAARGMVDYVSLHGSHAAMEIEESLMLESDDCELNDAQKEEAGLLMEIADAVAKRANMDGDDATRPFAVDLMLLLEEKQIGTDTPLFKRAMACGCRAMESFRARRNASGGIDSENFSITAIAGETDRASVEEHGKFFSREQFSAVTGKIKEAFGSIGEWAKYKVPLVPLPFLAISDARYRKKKAREEGYSTKVVTAKRPFSALPSVTNHESFAKALEERGIKQTDPEYLDIANATEVWNGLSDNTRLQILSGFELQGVFPERVTKALDVLKRRDFIRPNADSTGESRMIFDDPVMSGRPHQITIFREQIKTLVKGEVDEASIDTVTRSIEEAVRSWNEFFSSHNDDALDLLNRRIDIDDESKISPDLRRSLLLLEHHGLLKRMVSPFERVADREAARDGVSRWHELIGFEDDVAELSDDDLDAKAGEVREAMRLRRDSLRSFLEGDSDDFESLFSDADLSAALSIYGGEFIDRSDAHDMLRGLLMTRNADEVCMMQLREGGFASLDEYIDSLGLSDVERPKVEERLKRYGKFVDRGLIEVPEDEEFDLFEENPDDRMSPEEILERAKKIPELADAVNNCSDFVTLYSEWLACPASERALALRVDRSGKYEHFLTIIEGVDGATKDKAPRSDGLFASPADREAARTSVDSYMGFFEDGSKEAKDLDDFQLLKFSADVEQAKLSAVADVREAIKNKTTSSLSDLQIAVALGLRSVSDVASERSVMRNMPRMDAPNSFAAKMKGRYLSMLEYGCVDADDYFSSVETVADSIRDRSVANLDAYRRYVDAGLIQVEQPYFIQVSADEMRAAADARDAADSRVPTDRDSLRYQLDALGDIEELKQRWAAIPIADKVRLLDNADDIDGIDDRLMDFLALAQELGCMNEASSPFASDEKRREARDLITKYGDFAGLSDVAVDSLSDADLDANYRQVLACRERAKDRIVDFINGISRDRPKEEDLSIMAGATGYDALRPVGDAIEDCKKLREGGQLGEIRALVAEFESGSETDMKKFIEGKGFSAPGAVSFYGKYMTAFRTVRDLGLI